MELISNLVFTEQWLPFINPNRQHCKSMIPSKIGLSSHFLQLIEPLFLIKGQLQSTTRTSSLLTKCFCCYCCNLTSHSWYLKKIDFCYEIQCEAWWSNGEKWCTCLKILMGLWIFVQLQPERKGKNNMWALLVSSWVNQAIWCSSIHVECSYTTELGKCACNNVYKEASHVFHTWSCETSKLEGYVAAIFHVSNLYCNVVPNADPKCTSYSTVHVLVQHIGGWLTSVEIV